MKRYAVFLLILIAASTGARRTYCQTQRIYEELCPLIVVDCQDFGPTLKANAKLNPGNPSAKVAFKWTVSVGKITGGQGSDSISIDTSGFEGQGFTATVEVGGLSKTCPNTGSCSTRVLAQTPTPTPPPNYPAPAEGDYVIPNFRFRSGEVLPELKIHYRTIGALRTNSSGVAQNAVLIGHGTGGAGTQFLSPQFGNVLFGPGGLLDARRYFIVLADGIGHGKSSKPSDGLHTRFPHYNYDDMVAAHYELLTKKLGVNHLRLVMGTSMGGMQTWVWGETYPDFMDALMPLASLPVEIAGRNRIWRRMAMDAIRDDPEWLGGEYKTEPMRALTAAENLLLFVGSAPLFWQKQAPTRDTADKFYADRLKAAVPRLDANDLLYQLDSSREYNPAPKLEMIKAPLVAINSADDVINPPELRIIEREIRRVKRGRFILLPITDQTRGHGTHTLPLIWQRYLKELLAESRK